MSEKSSKFAAETLKIIDMRKITIILVALIAATMSFAQSSGFQKLDEWTEVWKKGQQTYFGYPCNQQPPLLTRRIR